MRKYTKIIRIDKAIILIKKVVVVLPSPFSIVNRVVFVYKNGHKNDRIRMYLHARKLWNI